MVATTACRRVVLVLVLLMASASLASAQPRARVRVTTDRATIWRPGFTTMATIVSAGTILDVVSRQGDWYEVLLPPTGGTGETTGMIYAGRVELVAGSPEPPRRAPSQTQPAREPTSEPSEFEEETAVGVRGFGSFGYDWISAHKAFDAVLGHSGGVVFGAGGQVRWKRLVFEGSVERFRQTGERVFVTDTGDVFKLGIPDTITLVPITATVAYRLSGHGAVPYVGGGIGQYRYTEESQFADPAENVEEHFTGYHVLGGIEWRNGLVATAFEVQYTHVPDAFSSGVASVFNEHNLGGVQARVKILVGR